MTDRAPIESREAYRWFTDVTLRWNDIDMLGHVNNARYFEFFDTAVLAYLHTADLGIGSGRTTFVVAETGCRFHREIRFADRLAMGLRIERIGTSSVRYGLAAFVNDIPHTAASGHFVHVCVDPDHRRPMPFPSLVRQHLEAIRVED